MRTPIATPFILSACLIASLLAPRPVEGQSGFFIRLASEVSALSVEHTKTVTIGGGSSASTSSSSGFGTAILVTGGVRSSASAGWMFGSELEVVLPSPRLLKGTIDPTNSGNPHDVWPGRWEFSDKLGVGGTFLAGRSVDGGGRPDLPAPRSAPVVGGLCHRRHQSRRPASRARTASGWATGPCPPESE